MEYKLLGVKINLINVAICVALGFLICVMIGCDCVNISKIKEEFISGSSCSKNNINVASPLAPLVGGAPSMDAAPVNKKGCNKKVSAEPASVEGEKMFYLNEHDVEYKPECCTKSVYSNSMGCACLSDSQFDYLHKRGGNRTMGQTEY